MKWQRRQLTADENLDPDLLMWDIRRRAMHFGEMPVGRHVVKFQLSGVPVSHRFYWLVLNGAETGAFRKWFALSHFAPQAAE
jgi:hypothetical protein